MKIAIIGGGPAGLYFASYLKQHAVQCDITVFEAQHESMNAFGLGYTLQKLDSILLARLDADFYQQLFPGQASPLITEALFKTNHQQRILPFAEGFSVTRQQLLDYLRKRAQGMGVTFINRKVRPESLPGLQARYDLVIAADGINSIARQRYARHLQAQSHTAKLKFSWFFNESEQQRREACFYAFHAEEGVTLLTSYPLSLHKQVVVIEMTDHCLASNCLQGKAPTEAIPYLNALLSNNGDQINLQATGLPWYTFRMNTLGRMYYQNLSLIGDAAYSFHYSAGQGVTTSFSMAYTLAQCLLKNASIAVALTQYHQAISMLLAEPSQKSLRHMKWFERIDQLFADSDSAEWLDMFLQKDEYRSAMNREGYLQAYHASALGL
jgi:2-polyprenyl-6-methoxyphenol hydroxylase-like FAD-dependent oxidoreductase